MPLFQDFGKRFADAAKVVGKRTAEATEVVRLNGRQANLQDEIERLMGQIGKAYFSMRTSSGECEAANLLCAQVDKLTTELEAVKNELDRLRNLRRCPNCGEVQAATAAFCASCGTKMPEPPPELEEPEPEGPKEDAAEPLGDAPEVEISWPKPEAEQEPEPEDKEE